LTEVVTEAVSATAISRRNALKFVLAGAASASLAACATTGRVVTGAFKIGKDYTVTLGQNWGDVSGYAGGVTRGVKLLTIDGPLLNSLYASPGLNPGQGILRQRRLGAASDRPLPAYRADMSSRELTEMVADTVSEFGYLEPETQNLRPAKFGVADGVRFDIATRTSRGLNVSGTALVAEHNKKLHVLLFLAPDEHYFGATLPEVEKVFASVVLTTG
jgi:hypothetical protein